MPSAGCLDEHDILAFATGELGDSARSRALEHVDSCEVCRQLAAALARDASHAEREAAHDESHQRRSVSSSHDDALPSSRRRASDIGRRIDGRFVIEETLGRGGMATVYRARDEKLGIDVALKLLDPHADDRDDKTFARELLVGRRVTHPNVCRHYDGGRHEGATYITMEIVDGETLADVIKRDVPVDRAIAILDGIASGLAAVHSEGIVHRDLKPANVMIDRRSGRAILTDFGFAADLEAKQSRRLVGTPSFWAPEQARGETPTPASDVFSFGVIAYRLLSGGREYSLSDSSALTHVPKPFRAVLAKCLAPRPSERYATASEVLVALRACGRRNIGTRVLPIVIGAGAITIAILVGNASRRSPDLPQDLAPPNPAAATTLPPAPSAPSSSSAPSAEPPLTPSTELAPRPSLLPKTPARPQVPRAKPIPTAPTLSSDPLYRH